MKIKILTLLALSLGIFTSCENDEKTFDDYEFTGVYFAYQFPVRTITLGEDIYDTTLDNAYKCKIMGTIGGLYTNKQDVSIDISVNNSLATGLVFNQDDELIEAMPSNYYNLLSDKIVIPKGELSGGVEVQLTDAFFADPKATTKKYVIPLQMNRVVHADSILSGKALWPDSKRGILTDWSVAPKDFILYAVKYINPWDGFYLRRGIDDIVGKNGNDVLTKKNVRHKEYVEYDEVFRLSTKGLKQTKMPLIFKDADGSNINCELLLTFDNEGNCTIASNTSGVTASGSGKFVKKGEKNSWGSKDRDALYLNYSIDMNEMSVTTADTLVARNRGVVLETFAPVLSVN